MISYTVMLKYEQCPGAEEKPPAYWPGQSCITREPGKSSLLLFIHPKCPCTSAVLTELSKLLARADSKRLRTSILFLKPSGMSEDWEKTNFYYRAQAIPAVKILIDRESREREIFNASTSGRTLLYSPTGELVFAGGITAGRGHEGDNQGSDAILKLLQNTRQTACVATSSRLCFCTPVFGCSLTDNSHLRQEIIKTCLK